MSVRFSFTVISVLLWSVGASATCISGTPNCPDLGNIPEIAQKIVGQEKIVAPPVTPPPSDTSSSYTGPTVGVSSVARRAPTIGYHWATE